MFRTNVPVTAEGFFDREGELTRLETVAVRVAAGEPVWLAILGPRKIGKTSLVLELARRNMNPSLVFVVLDTFEEIPLSLQIFRRYVLRLLDAIFASELGESLEAALHRPAAFRAALQLSERFMALPPTLRGRLLELPDRAVDQGFVADALRLPEQLADALDLRILVAWDEFQELASLGTGRHTVDPFPLMRSTWQRHQRIGYVISGSQRSILSELVTAERSPFFQHFSILELGPFAHDEAVRLLVQSAPENCPIPPALAHRAVDVIGGHPFYLQLLGEELTAQQPPYNDASLKAAIQDLLFSRTGRLALYLENIYQGLVGRSTFLAATLQALAPGPCRLTDVSVAIGAPTGSAVRYLERLRDAVRHTDDGKYALADPTLGLWLRWRQPGGAVVPMTTVGNDAEKRVAEHLARMGFELVYQSRASRGAFDLLATRGAAQLGLQIKRSKLPLRFGRAAWDRMVADAKRFGWRWVIVAVSPSPDADIPVLDPARARVGREVRLHAEAAIENLLLWLDER